MNLRRLLPLAALAAALLLAAPAQASPSPKDARAAADRAELAVERSLSAATTGSSESAIGSLAKAQRLQARAVRISRRAAAVREPAPGARLLRATTAGVDDGFDSFAELLPDVPAELQPHVLAALERFEGMRAELIAELTGLVEALPPGVRDQVLSAIAAFTTDGDIESLIAALSDPAIGAAIQEQLGAFIAELTATLGEQIAGLEGLAELFPPGALEELEAAMAQLQVQLEEAFAVLTGILGEGAPGLPELPPLPGALCAELEAVFEALGLPVPPGFCPA